MGTPTSESTDGIWEATDASNAAEGLAGTMPRPVKVTILGAGSAFAPRLANDLVRIPNNHGGVIALVDVDRERLALSARLISRLLNRVAPSKWTVTATTDRLRALPGSQYVVNCIEVSGVRCVRLDNDIPRKFGVDQCIGDTIGPGGLFKALRTIPVWLAVLRDCERLCSEALVLNYTNPMVMMCLAAFRSTPLPVIGLCHSVQFTSQLLAVYAGVPYQELEWECGGINHLSWFTKLAHRGTDLYPKLKRQFADDVAVGLSEFDHGYARHDDADNSHGKTVKVRYTRADLVRKDMCLRFGAFITESSGHLSEYLPYYRSTESGKKLLRLGYDGGSRFYATNWPRWRSNIESERRRLLRRGDAPRWPRSGEYASWIIEAREKGAPYAFHGNVPNRTPDGTLLIPNLPAHGCVEVQCRVDTSGVRPVAFGALPPQMAAVCASNMAMFDLGAQAAIERSVQKAVYALLLDPLTAAVCSPADVEAMTHELFKAEKKFLVGYR